MTDHLSLLSLTIRFSASIPDVLLEIPDPAHLTAAGLKQLIRQRLPHDLSTHRLRLIYAGKALDDASSLASLLNITATPPGIRDEIASSPLPDHYYRAGDGGNGGGKDKGKAPVRDPPTPRLRTYIHCSIGDIILSAKELEAEARLARIAEGKDSGKWEGKGLDGSSTLLKPSSAASSAASNILRPPQSSTSGSLAISTSATTAAPRGTTSLSLSPSSAADHSQSSATSSRHPPPTATGPRGFDRLLDAGFTVAEVSALRSQFLALQSLSHTPDTMPSGAELRRLEDIWMDEGGSAGSVEGEGGGGGGGGGGAGIANYGVGSTSGAAGPLDDMLWGSVMGFFWPVGCGLWLLREQGVWSWRKGLAVFVGIVVNFGFGVVRFLN
ncbi:hypothetical protein GX51_06708 [Blastomyces parvus]|uniref:Ubiquitin-like domain-containing protein n=1 Tax=Blastomyces parvus TaxID=2060905 RepID=A0A2B7WH10_9EURO|nr:hypothetical protein GX51_06708 [Blastomyces parvus]